MKYFRESCWLPYIVVGKLRGSFKEPYITDDGETCVDIANHIIADKKYRVPKSYADTFRVLYEEGVLEEGIFKTMEDMAKFRNIVSSL